MSGKAVGWARGVSDLTPTQKLILLLLADHAGQHEEYGNAYVCWPSQGVLASDAGVSTRTVIRALAEMEEMGLITRKRQHYADGHRRTDLYFLPVDGQGDRLSGSPKVTSVQTQGDTDDDPKVTMVSPQEQQEEPPKNTHPAMRPEIIQFALIPSLAAPTSITATFDQFWEAYPKKVGKGDAKGAFKTAVKKAPLPVLLAAIEKQKATTWLGKERQYIPNPATWLRQERWEDEAQQPARPDRPRGEKYLTDRATGLQYLNPEWKQAAQQRSVGW